MMKIAKQAVAKIPEGYMVIELSSFRSKQQCGQMRKAFTLTNFWLWSIPGGLTGPSGGNSTLVAYS